ncbi:transposase [Rhodococcus sp. IEGM 1366]|uniref:transposase n=1 Tax=Rhodococcus sp. IEGM 1366 TaxID=3082223 RepID=UPI00295352BA|nr:transposase [Rhodococcus sp. IEGM 1366]MDV8070985.1 transposase [Rhodococcus sp. IEGM 1366]
MGVDSASTLLVSAGDNPERLHSEASFAALCGVSPIEASSGSTPATASPAAEIVKPTTRSGESR